MRITPHIFDAFLKCATKCHLRSFGEIGAGNEYAEWVRGQDESYRREAVKALQEAVPETERVFAPPATENLKAAKWRLAVDLLARTPDRLMDSSLGADAMLTDHEPPTTHPSPCPLPATRGEGGGRPGEGSDVRKPGPNEEARGLGAPGSEQLLESRLHAVERVPSEGRGKPAQFIPIRFVFRNKLTKDDRLLLAFDALVLSQMLGREVGLGKIVHGDDHATLKVKTSVLATQVRKRIQKLAALLSNTAPSDLVLNRHCAECEFQARCRKIAVEKDDLSLLARMSGKERQELRSKGIFTITQLSYTFRPRRRPKKLRDKKEKYHHSLKALAIREKKIHIVGSPKLKIEGTPVYLDVEGLPDRDFYYLIGLRIGNGESAIQHSLWADTVADEGKIWREFLAILETVEQPVLLHYGSFENTFLKELCERHAKPDEGSAVSRVIGSTINVLSVIFSQIYFPSPSNGLKDIAHFLGFKWAEPESSGSKSIIWRSNWERSADPTLQRRLITYNSEDCEALEMVAYAILQVGLSSNPVGSMTKGNEVVSVDSIKTLETMWPKFKSPISAFEEINKAAQWDYQRDKVYVRSSRRIRRISQRKRLRTKRPLPIARILKHPECDHCPTCNKKGYRHYDVTKRVLYDIHIGRFNLRRRIVEYHYHVFWCSGCKMRFGIPKEFWPESKFGRNFVAYLLYHAIGLRIPMGIVRESVNRLWGLDLAHGIVNQFKVRAARFYAETHQAIIKRLASGKLIHVDETQVSIKGKTAFVWVLTSLHEVAYVYADTREVQFVKTLLVEFRGVMISDFYTAYDSFECLQQKCLIHLMRDLNQEILDHPYDEELKQIVTSFSVLLKPMIETVDRYGLKKHYLRKHQVPVARFYHFLNNADCKSEAAIKCKQRFEKNRDKLFTFLEHDGVPWNNNNAEHAIKAFAALRDIVQGSWTEKAVGEHLVLLSICQTCKYMGVDFLDFLRSGEKDIHAFAESRRGRKRRTQASQPAGLPPDVIPDTSSQP
ncbi:MAG: IS66 family transposase [Verrucomicrobia bacterium]|nr:IS66 family transposase [Verrucomicrobiota bacterium]